MALLLAAAIVFFTGIGWGLPSRAGDQFLLGADGHGNRLEALTSTVPEVDSNRGADVVAPTGPADQIVVLNDTDAKKAQILCRYRLYSFQPDEMITFRSLSAMKPLHGDFDPRLYQYGGLWIYGVGATIETGRLFGLLHVAGRAEYLANPKLFGRFYVAARVYSALWGLLGVLTVFEMTRRMTGGRFWLSLTSAFCFAIMPVVVNAAHEAKPHLAGATLTFLAILSADNLLRTNHKLWAWLTGVACGAAMGMVLWGAVTWIVIPILGLLLKNRSSSESTILPQPAIIRAFCGAIIAYAVTNPYVIYHLLTNPALLQSNLGNTAAMYGLGRPDQAFENAIRLMLFGAGPLIVFGGLIAWSVLIWQRNPASIGTGSLLVAVAAPAAVQFIITAAGKPGEYGRFALLPDAALLIALFAALARLSHLFCEIGAKIVLFGTLALAPPYLIGFAGDSNPLDVTSRTLEAMKLKNDLTFLGSSGKSISSHPTLGVYADPAPYCLPPVDLDGWRIVRLPKGYDARHGPPVADVIVFPDEQPYFLFTPLSWANKNFQIIERSRP